MCKVMDKYIAETTIKTAVRYGASKEDVIRDLMKELDYTRQEAEKAYNEYCPTVPTA